MQSKYDLLLLLPCKCAQEELAERRNPKYLYGGVGMLMVKFWLKLQGWDIRAQIPASLFIPNILEWGRRELKPIYLFIHQLLSHA